MSLDQSKFCPMCGSPRVDEGSLIGSLSKCRNCSWQGPSDKLIIHRFRTSLLEGTDVITRFSGEMRDLVAKEMSVPVGKVLVKWGFLPNTNIDVMVWGRYMNAIARAIVTAVIVTRDELEAEQEKEAQDAEV